MKNLKKFLVKAKKNTYASNGEFGEKRLADGAKELTFKRGNFFYRDRYYGSNKFIGQEVVFYDKKSIWAMNYSGRCFKSDISVKEIYVFLKKCLKKVSVKNIFRGPENYKLGDFKYKNKSSGNVDDFFGEEIIYFKNKKVYELKYHGGLVVR
ncbi:MAG: DUF5680 domain-containing protein [Patescibacteria group bacterium]|nr:DUF5680 domain-containing protein [Patescibacteria group bacterium]